MAVDVTLKADITVVCGSSGSGKSGWIKQQLKGRKRVIVWDVDEEYTEESGFVAVRSISELLGLLKRRKTGRFAYVPESLKEFNAWCMAAFYWGYCTAIAEETADVTTPSKAPAGWGILVRRGRKRGVSIFGVTQRPAESDKTIMGNASMIHCGYLELLPDRQYMAVRMGLSVEDLENLEELEFFQKRKKVINKGKVIFKDGASKKKQKATSKSKSRA